MAWRSIRTSLWSKFAIAATSWRRTTKSSWWKCSTSKTGCQGWQTFAWSGTVLRKTNSILFKRRSDEPNSTSWTNFKIWKQRECWAGFRRAVRKPRKRINLSQLKWQWPNSKMPHKLSVESCSNNENKSSSLLKKYLGRKYDHGTTIINHHTIMYIYGLSNQ